MPTERVLKNGVRLLDWSTSTYGRRLSAPDDSHGTRYSFPHLRTEEHHLLHPNLTPFHISGHHGTFNTTGFVMTDFLKTMHGNGRKPEGVRHYERKLLNGEGFDQPIELHYHPASGTATIAEGNHRLEAAANLGLSFVPTTLVRRSSPLVSTPSEGRKVNYIRHGSEEDWPVREKSGAIYIPATMHPKWVLDKGYVLPDNFDEQLHKSEIREW